MDNFSAGEPAVGYSERDHTSDIDLPKTTASETVIDVEFGSGWYHATAIVEAEQAKPRLQLSGR